MARAAGKKKKCPNPRRESGIAPKHWTTTSRTTHHHHHRINFTLGNSMKIKEENRDRWPFE
uniref:Uncharacterized protein n=1 Tax=Rhizophora mucronata TaxID=61149 RepID=A0A2P2NIQ1_RHIMU